MIISWLNPILPPSIAELREANRKQSWGKRQKATRAFLAAQQTTKTISAASPIWAIHYCLKTRDFKHRFATRKRTYIQRMSHLFFLMKKRKKKTIRTDSPFWESTNA